MLESSKVLADARDVPNQSLAIAFFAKRPAVEHTPPIVRDSMSHKGCCGQTCCGALSSHLLHNNNSRRSQSRGCDLGHMFKA